MKRGRIQDIFGSSGSIRGFSRVLFFLLPIVFLISSHKRVDYYVGVSLEWYTYVSDVIATGTITELSEGRGKGGEKVVRCRFQIKKLLKSDSASKTLSFTETVHGMDRVKKMKGKELMLFLRRTTEAYTTPRGYVYNLWPIRGGRLESGILPLDGPMEPMVRLETKEIIREKDALIKAIGKIHEKLREFTPEEEENKLSHRKYSRLPRELRSKGVFPQDHKVFLYVPGFMFPEAKDSFY